MGSNYVKGEQVVLVKQRIQTSIRIVLSLAVATVLLAVAHSSIASAQSTANIIKVAPVRTDVEVQPGTVKTIPMTITNLTNDDISIRATANDFVSGDESGRPALILEEDEFAPNRSLKRYITPIPDTIIAASKSKTINVVVTIPKDAKAGGYFGAIRFAPTTPDSGGQVNMSASVASLILLTVAGDFTENLILTDFNILQSGKVGTDFRTPENLEASVRFKNEGDVQNGPFGIIAVKQNGKVIYQTNFNDRNPKDMILPDGARRWDVPLDKVGTLGYFEVIGTFTYGKTNQTIEVTKGFWVIPQLVIILAFVLLGVIILAIVGIILLVRHRKKRRRGMSGGFRR